ncbi:MULTISPECIES: OmpA family protein [unclassified Acinetobacter]|uniref:OmpA family protein n=1 Tax=unclassified Acinetobacter TaxID=196816 RepID=UPI0035BA28B4
MKKLYVASAMTLLAVSLTGCVGTKYLSKDITNEGTVEKENIVFPELDKAWQKDGQFPNSENLSKIKPGIAKDELYQLIGRPHFSERQHAREWDYIMKFYQADESVKICQYKVIFDKDYKGQEFYWKPADCAQYAQAPRVTSPTGASPSVVPVAVIPKVMTEKFNLGADALFEFDKWRTEDMKPEGRRQLDELAVKLLEWEKRGESRINIVGHTDLLGEDAYNMNLSMLRAQTVRSYLATRGVNSSTMMSSGAGESEPVKQCDMNLARPQLIECLQPNRRVEVSVTIYTH